VQRLFATFPDGQPGIALLILRLSLSAVLLVRGTEFWPVGPSHVVSISVAAFLAIGLYTPYVGILGACAGCVGSLQAVGTSQMDGWFTLAILVAVGLLGAGAYSADARLYGRRRFVL